MNTMKTLGLRAVELGVQAVLLNHIANMERLASFNVMHDEISTGIMLYKRAINDLRHDDTLRKYLLQHSASLEKCESLCRDLEGIIYTGDTIH